MKGLSLAGGAAEEVKLPEAAPRVWPQLYTANQPCGWAHNPDTGEVTTSCPASGSIYHAARFDRGVSAGKHYFEMTVTTHVAGGCYYFNPLTPADNVLYSYSGYLRGYFCNTGFYPTVGVAVDMDVSPPLVRFVYQGQISPTSGTLPSNMQSFYNLQVGGPASNFTLYPATLLYSTQGLSFNFGQRPWVNQPPAGYEAGWAP